MPCDDAVGEDTCVTEVHFYENIGKVHNDADLCSPFCQCVCCHISIASPQIYQLSSFYFSADANPFGYFENTGKDYFKYALQPPQRCFLAHVLV